MQPVGQSERVGLKGAAGFGKPADGSPNAVRLAERSEANVDRRAKRVYRNKHASHARHDCRECLDANGERSDP